MYVRILLAEDNLINQKVATRMLEKMGFEIDVVANGKEVVRAIEQRPYDIILMDVMMPEMDGLKTTQFIRSHFEADQQPYIIALTANALSEDRDICLKAGMNEFITKPIRRDEFERQVRQAVSVVSSPK